MGEAGTIGFDIAKSVFQVHGVDVAGAVVIRKRVTRSKVLEYFGELPPCLVGIEACPSAHHCASNFQFLSMGQMSRHLWTTVCRTTSRIDAPNQLRKA